MNVASFMFIMISDIMKFRVLDKLKSVERSAVVGSRHESPAEHSWGCLMLADFFLSRMDLKKTKIDRLHVYELLMYHDVVEIIAGDAQLHPNNVDARKKKEVEEQEAAKILKEKIPAPLGEKFFKLFQEFEDQKTVESRFAKAIDKTEAEIHELDYKERWKGWTPEFLIKVKGPFVEEFPELKNAFYELLEYEKREGYFGQ